MLLEDDEIYGSLVNLFYFKFIVGLNYKDSFFGSIFTNENFGIVGSFIF
jgi:hypothetical protein